MIMKFVSKEYFLIYGPIGLMTWLISNGPDCVTTLKGSLSDQAALIGILIKIQSLNLTIISVKRSNPKI